METRSNHLLVGAVVLALLAAVVGFTVWIAGRGGGPSKEYDIFFRQSVEGLNRGSSVSYAGVPSGTVEKIELWKANPEFVRVRIAVNEDVPILIGTTATIQGVGFTGVSQIQLQGAAKGAPPISEVGPAGVPVIPTRTAGLGALLNNAPQLIERLSTLTERLTEVLSDTNQRNFEGILKNTNALTGRLSDSAPELRKALVEIQVAVRDIGAAADQVGVAAGSTATLVDQEGRPMITQLRKTVAQAERSLATLDAAVAEARPGLRSLSTDTMPEVNQLVRDLRTMSDSISALTAKIDQQGAGALIGGQALPDYKPGRNK